MPTTHTHNSGMETDIRPYVLAASNVFLHCHRAVELVVRTPKLPAAPSAWLNCLSHGTHTMAVTLVTLSHERFFFLHLLSSFNPENLNLYDTGVSAVNYFIRSGIV